MAQMPTLTEADILRDVIGVEVEDLSPEVARAILQWRFSDQATERIGDLTSRNNRGTISDVERDELEKYLRVGGLINLVQAKARVSLQKSHPN